MPQYPLVYTEAQAAKYWGIRVDFPPPPVLPPVVTPATFDIVLPVAPADSVGIVQASGNPTAFAITGGNANGYYQIANSGLIVVTTAGSTGIVAGTDTLTVTASNAGGTSPGATITINVT
jgi:hypothetical protein